MVFSIITELDSKKEISKRPTSLHEGGSAFYPFPTFTDRDVFEPNWPSTR